MNRDEFAKTLGYKDAHAWDMAIDKELHAKKGFCVNKMWNRKCLAV